MEQVTPPDNFRDAHPHRGLWWACDVRPKAFLVVDLLYPDGTSRAGYWNGKKWSTPGKNGEPIGWRKIELIG